jgi:ATP-binding cassette subfamily F protein 3
MLVVSNISKRFPGADEPILKDISFTVNPGERVGLIGPNGSGKSTLINIIIGSLLPDTGSIQFNPPNLRIGYLAQGITAPDNTPIREVLFPQANALYEAEADLERLGAAMVDAKESDMNTLSTAYSDALERLERASREVDSGEAERILAGLNLDGLNLDAPVGTLSGGQKTRLGLSALLLNQPQLLILDEPTNHLDVTGIEWLETWLQNFQGGILVVSHDRTFLDEIVTSVVAINQVKHTARVFEGNYSDYVATVRSEWDKQWSQWRDQQVEIARLKYAADRTMARSVRKENATNNDQQRRYAKKVAKRAKAMEKRLDRYLESDDRVEKPERTWSLRMDNLNSVEALPPDREIITLRDVSIGYDASIPLLTNFNLTLMSGERVAVLGPNGQGKSTLMKTVIGELPPLTGTVRIANTVKIGYLAQEQEILDPTSTPLETLLAAAPMTQTEARTFLHFYLFTGDEVFTPIAQLSYGERACLMLAALVARGANLLVLDEPINHLDVPARERFEQAMSAFQGSVLAVVHDRYFVDKFATKIWHIENSTLTEEIRRVDMA